MNVQILDEKYGDEFEELYKKYENEGKARKVIPVHVIYVFNYILTSSN